MKTLSEIADSAASGIVRCRKELEQWEKIYAIARENEGIILEGPQSVKEDSKTFDADDFPGYNMDDLDLLPKIKAVETKLNVVWSRKELQQIITGIEKKRSKKTLSNLNFTLGTIVASKEMFRVFLNGSKRYAFCFTNRDWIEKVMVDGKIKIRIKEQFFYSQTIRQLKPEYKNQDNMKWDNLNDPTKSEENQ